VGKPTGKQLHILHIVVIRIVWCSFCFTYLHDITPLWFDSSVGGAL